VVVWRTDQQLDYPRIGQNLPMEPVTGNEPADTRENLLAVRTGGNVYGLRVRTELLPMTNDGDIGERNAL